MISAKSISIILRDPSQVGQARRASGDLARQLGLPETQQGQVSLVATEAAGNVIKHAREGELILRPLVDKSSAGVEILVLDKGPGMENVERCLEDGYSTAGSPGTGLGAMRRLSHCFDIHSLPGKGTVLLSQIWGEPGANSAAGIIVGAVCVAKGRAAECGDAWSSHLIGSRGLLMVADGIGHGPLAARAADEAVRVFRDNVSRSPAEILHATHGPLRATRGTGVSIAAIHYGEQTVHYSGLGNISGAIVDGASVKCMVTLNGTLGHEWHQVREFTYPWPKQALLVMHSDGLQTRWNLEDYPGLRQRHPSVIAGVLYRDFNRGNDDVTVLAARVFP